MNTPAAAFRLEGGASYQTRWYKTMKTSEKSLVPLTEGKVTLTNLFKSEGATSLLRRREVQVHSCINILIAVFSLFLWLTNVEGE